MLRATDHAHLLLQSSLQAGDWVVDATVGNGYDTAFLAACVGTTGRVFGFDVQAAALESAKQRLLRAEQVTMFGAGHERLAECLPSEAKGKLTAVMFNLGYLPGAAKSVTTSTVTTLAAVSQALDFIAVKGLISIVVYPGHPGGAEEAAAVIGVVEQLPRTFVIMRCARINPVRPAPELLMIERRV